MNYFQSELKAFARQIGKAHLLEWYAEQPRGGSTRFYGVNSCV